jgi:hypothetical protein
VVAAQSPRLLYSATLGNSRDDPRNPNGVAAVLAVNGALNSMSYNESRQSDPAGSVYATRVGRNPVGVGGLPAAFPRVAEYSNPGLEDESPSGKMSKQEERCF